MHATLPLLANSDFPPIRRAGLDTLQVNLGYKCNQSCLHCHVNAGPKRTEMMSRHTIDELLAFTDSSTVRTLDLTGGAPELNPHFRYLVDECVARGKKVIDRASFQSFGCQTAIAVASMATEMLKGKSVDEASAISSSSAIARAVAGWSPVIITGTMPAVRHSAIACPTSMASLAAAARPAEGEALYFVADGKGGHTFSATLEAHQAAVKNNREVPSSVVINRFSSA